MRSQSHLLGFAAAGLFTALASPDVAARPATVSTPVEVRGTTIDTAPRDAAQKGLDYLAKASVEWGSGHACFGCHVHAVALEAFVVGRENQYRVEKKPVEKILGAMLEGPGGAYDSHGLSYHGGSLLQPSKAFGGAAFAHFDQNVDDRARKGLLKTAEELLAYQLESGAVSTGGWVNTPVGIGDLQTTYQSVQTWRQAYARTADARWQAPIRKAEAWLRAEAKRFAKEGTTDLQLLDYAALGLIEAGAGQDDPTVRALRGEILERQNKDGGFSLNKGSTSDAFATGQALYTLRMLGMSDRDKAVDKGTRWLIAHQQASGAWSSLGSSKAEAMWGVLGLVSVDVVSLDVGGLVDGRHIDKPTRVHAVGTDNEGGEVTRVELRVDDLTVATSVGATLDATFNPAGLEDGLHFVDVLAVNKKGRSTRRRFAVYVGDHFLTDVGSRNEGEKTTFSVRNLASEKSDLDIKLEVRMLDVTGRPVGAPVHAVKLPKGQEALTYGWEGKDKDGKRLPAGRYQAELVVVDGAGKTRQKVEHLFYNGSEAAGRAAFAEVEGKLSLDDGDDAANATVELLDDDGNVVQSAKTTRSGQYRFKNVDKGKYKVRVKKDGFAAEEMDFEAAPAAAPVKMKEQSLKRK